VYERTPTAAVSWFQPDAPVSLDLIVATGADGAAAVLDVGGGASTLVDGLLEQGYHDVTVLDIAEPALDAARTRLGPRADLVHWVIADVLEWRPERTYRVWHDRAVFHFLTEPADRDRYRAVVGRALEPGGHLVLGTFAADGPTRCSGLPTARYDPAELAAEFGDYRMVRAIREEHRTPGDQVQPFTWVLLAG
jgi:SAM-dependent methyltransferase